jgi:hypothetical protein
LGLIFLKYADAGFEAAKKELDKKDTGRRKVSKIDYQEALLCWQVIKLLKNYGYF